MTGRGGRGEALRRLLEAQEAEEKEKESAIPLQQDVEARRVCMGRGALQSIYLTSEGKSNGSVGVVGSTPATVIPGRGRSQLHLAATEVSRPMPSCSSTPAEDVETLTKTLGHASLKETSPVIMKGTYGQSYPATSNYIRLNLEPGKGVYEYEVRYEPEIDSRDMRFKLMGSQSAVIGKTKTFDGTVLYLPFQLPEQVTVLYGKLPSDESDVKISVIFKKKKLLGEAIHLYNILFRRIMSTLGLALLGKHYFDPSSSRTVPLHKLEIWPGYITAVDEYEGGIMLCCDASHRILRSQTVYDLLRESNSMNPKSWQSEFMKLIVGQVVLTRYNNKSYRIDDVNFEENPSSEFSYRKSDGSKISYMDYYQKHYEITIKDRQQPMLISKKKRNINGKEVIDLISLIPELCFMTGLTDNLRNDMRVMKDIAQITRITPHQRQYALRQFINNVNSKPDAKSILDSWGLSLADGTVDIDARILPPEDIYFGNDAFVRGTPQAEWTRAISNNSVLSAVDLMEWLIVYIKRDDQIIKDFVDMIKKCGPQMGMKVANPKLTFQSDDRTETYLKSLRNGIKQNSQMAVIVFPTARSDKYSAVKKLLCTEIGLSSQVIQTKTIRRADKLRSVVQKIALQINCKLGGTLWSVKIPMKSGMICGIDTYHDPTRKGSSIAGFVASLNMPPTRWFSKISKQSEGKELVEGLTTSLLSALTKYHEVNGYYPDQIIIYRDGVGDGQLSVCQKYECAQLEACCEIISRSYKPKFLMVVVQKRINTRIFAINEGTKCDNPPPGTIVDHTVTRYSWYDFFLVSQNVRQGTVSPTHYVVIHNTSTMTPDQVQRLSYKLTHLYYNWPGTIRVPAPCQYAHKLAYLVGESTRKEACELLTDKLYYL